MKFTETIARAMLVLACASAADAEVIALFDGPDDTAAHTAFFDVTNGDSWADEAGGTDFAGAYLTNVGGISVTDQNSFVRTNQTGAAAADGDTLAKSIAGGWFHSFTLTTSATETLTDVEITADYWMSRGHSAVTSNLSILNNIDGFADGSEIGTISVGGGADNVNTPITSATFALPDLGTNSSMEVRLYFWDNSAVNNRIHRVDRVLVNATVAAVPEPSALGLLALTAAGLIFRQRRRQASCPSPRQTDART